MKNFKKIIISFILAVFMVNISSPNAFGQAYPVSLESGSLAVPDSSAIVLNHNDQEISEILVRYKGRKSPGFLQEGTSQEESQGGNLTKVMVSKGADLNSLMAKYKNDPDVESVQPNYVYSVMSVDDPYRASQWGLDVVQADSAWEANSSMGDGVTVAVLDTGIDLDHEDLSANITGGYNAINGGSYDDDNGHGTHVAGIIAAIPNNGRGVAGVAGHAKLLAVKVMDKDGKGTTDIIAKGVRWAADHGANIINLSFGGYDYDELFQQAVNYAYNKGCVVVAAAGNDGVNKISYPAAFDNVLAVGAVNASDELASFSNVGPKVEVYAPGVNIASTLPNHLKVNGAGDYGLGSGTSMAAPFVSGVAALIKSKCPSYGPHQIMYSIVSTAWNGVNPGPDGIDISGIVNANKALGGTSTVVVKPVSGDSLEDNNSPQRAVPVTGTSKLSASIYPESDSDWYRITVPAETRAYISLAPRSNLDIAMDIYEYSKAMTSEYLDVDNYDAGGGEDYSIWPADRQAEYYIKVFDSQGGSARKSYDLYVTYSPMSSSYKNTGLYVLPQRLYGSDRYYTAAAIANTMFGSSQYAVLATGEDYPDALSAAPLAKKYNAPILLTSPKTLEAPTKNTLSNLGVKKVFIVGGTGAISGDVEKDLASMGIECTRIFGSDRYATSLAVANYLGPVQGAFIASGESFPDALSVSSLAASLNYPILLTGKDALPQGAGNYLKSNGISKTYVIGGTGVISDSIPDSIPNSERIWGKDRYETNINVLEAFKDNINMQQVDLATGENYPDALAGSVFASLTNSPVLLVSSSVQDITGDYIRYNQAKIFTCYIFGGEGAVSGAVFPQLFGYTP